MIKTILTALLSLAITLPFSISVAQAEDTMDGMRKKRYRYRQRTHRVQVAADVVPWSQNSNKDKTLNLDLLYGYNFKRFELGPVLGLKGDFNALEIEAGAWGEFNFIKNTRKKRVVPALGLKVSFLQERNDSNLLMSPYLSLKYFPASRTGLVASLNYDIQTPFNNFFKRRDMGVGISIAYVHYFH